MHWARSGIVALACLMVVAWGVSVSWAQSLAYQLVDLGTLGGQNSQGFGISSTGTIVGSSLLTNNADTHASSDSAPGSPMTDLGTLDGQNSAAFGVNATGTVVGEAQNALGDTHAALWNAATLTDLGVLDGDISSSAKAINTAGNVVGVSVDAVSDERAFLYERTSLTDLGTLGGNTAAYGINDAGVVVGYSVDSMGTRRAFRWDSLAGMSDLLGGAADGDSAAWGVAGNFAYGQFTTSLGDRHAFRYDLSTALLTDLDTLGGNSSVAFAGNAAGIAVGTSRNALGDEVAFLYQSALGISDLNDLLLSNPDGVTLTAARGINDTNDIIAIGRLANGDVHAFYLASVAAPEPTPLFLIPGTVIFILFQQLSRRKC